MVNYQNAKVYLLRSHNTDKVYVGTTTRKLSDRFSEHKHRTKHYNCSSKEIFEYGDCYIELYKKYPCNDKEELRQIEGEVIRELDCVNKIIAGRTDEQYKEDNRVELRTKQKIYTEKNREEINKKQREDPRRSEKIECECGLFISRRNIANHKKTKTHYKLYTEKNNVC
jgi:hypothetical protein